MFGVTTNSFMRNLDWARKAIFSFSYAPLDMITWLAVAIVAISAVLTVVQIAMRLVAPQSVPSGFTTLIVLILFMGGVQLLCFSVIGAYLMHIYDEVKRRPPYIVDRILNAPAGSETKRALAP
jgi:dolichol-phosphate mannosyltransferase